MSNQKKQVLPNNKHLILGLTTGTISKDLHNKLVDSFDARAKNFQLKDKAYIKAQAEFFLLSEAKESSINPRIYFSIMRGEKITKFPEDDDNGKKEAANKIPDTKV